MTENSEWTVSCADATGVASAKLTVTRSTSGDGCSYTIDPVNTLTPAQQGDTTFTIPYTSTGGDTHNGVVTVYLGPDSDITFTAPTIPVGRNRTVEINALDHLTEGTGFTVTCADATGVDNTKLTSVSHTGDSCTFTVDPVDTLTPAQQGSTTFSVAFTSSGGDTETGAFTVNIGPDSEITFTAPSPKPSVAAGGSATLNVGSYASDGSYTISCGDATSIDSKITSISRTGCSYQVNASSSAAAGDATFTVPYTSSGGHTLDGVVTVAISNITVTTLTGLTVPAGKAIDFDLSGYGSDGDFTITCGDPPPASISVALTSVTPQRLRLHRYRLGHPRLRLFQDHAYFLRRRHARCSDLPGRRRHRESRRLRLHRRHFRRHRRPPQSYRSDQRSGGRLPSPGGNAEPLGSRVGQQQPARQLPALLGHGHPLAADDPELGGHHSRRDHNQSCPAKLHRSQRQNYLHGDTHFATWPDPSHRPQSP